MEDEHQKHAASCYTTESTVVYDINHLGGIMNDEKLSAIIKLEVLSTYTEQVLESIFARQTKRNAIPLIAGNFCQIETMSSFSFTVIAQFHIYFLIFRV